MENKNLIHKMLRHFKKGYCLSELFVLNTYKNSKVEDINFYTLTTTKDGRAFKDIDTKEVKPELFEENGALRYLGYEWFPYEFSLEMTERCWNKGTVLTKKELKEFKAEMLELEHSKSTIGKTI